jgi:hypothetical protein
MRPLAIPLECSALIDIDLRTADSNATETSRHAKIALTDFEKQYERFSKILVADQLTLQFFVETNQLLGMH